LFAILLRSSVIIEAASVVALVCPLLNTKFYILMLSAISESHWQNTAKTEKLESELMKELIKK
jgi:hypothetical protein